MTLARTAGRKGRPWLRLRQYVFARDGDTCRYCGHPGARAINHDDGFALSPDTRMDPASLSPIHGVEGCPICPPVWSTKRKRLIRRVCNSEVGAKPLVAALADRRLKDW